MNKRLLFLLLLMPTLAFGAEDCSMFDGKCRDACGANEVAMLGAFMDCTQKQECCVPKSETRKPVAPAAPVPKQKEEPKIK